ncbi:MAG: carbohydrate binding domain-containing protein, partial [Ignavibacteria bacterium]|nr:carbohydrate binding domain-containing protein [Ignavibacteria bacterium]
MKKVQLILLVLVVSFSLSTAQNNISVKNAGFEENGNTWKISGKGNVIFDGSVFHDGNKSVLVEHSDWNKTQIASEEVSLKVGHIYRLSGWAKSELVFSNNYDQYPTPVAACLTMESFPFTNSSPTVGATSDWKKLEVMFVALKSTDKVCLNFGYNGSAKGKVWFDDIQL